MKLFDYQIVAAKKLASNRGYLLAYSMGLGKTIIALSAATRINRRTVIVAPAFMKRTWERTIEEHFKDLKDFRVLSWNALKSDVEADVLIFDESHYMKNPEAQRSKAALSLAKATISRGGFVWMLSGTPAKNNAAELFMQFKALGMNQYENYEEFAGEFSNKARVRFGNMMIPKVVYKGVKNVEKLRGLYRPFMEVLKTEAVIELPLQIKSSVYSESSVFSKEDVEAFKEDPGVISDIHFSTKKALQAEMNLSTTIHKVEEVIDNGHKCVVFSDHVKTADTIAKHFDCGKITGSVSMNNRDKIIDGFKKYDKVLSCTIGAAGVGLNLQFANAMVFNDLPWVPADLMQAEKRIHRIGQQDRCFYYYVIDPGMGELIYKTLQEKIKDLEGIK